MPLKEFLDKTCFVGVGSTPQGQLPDKSGDDIAIWAFQLALEDAGLKKSDIDGLFVQSSFGNQGSLDEIGQRLGLEPRTSATVNPGGGRLFQLAASQVYLGMCDYAACIYGTNQRTNRNRFVGSPHHPSGNFQQVYGQFNPGSIAAFNFRRRMHDFGATEEQLGAIAVAQSKGAALNPLAVFRDPLTIEDYLASRYVIEPLRLVDFCFPTDGGFAFIITTPERAAGLKKRPVYIAGVGAQDSYLQLSHPDPMYHPSQPSNARSLFESSGFSPKDMDAVYVQDSYTPNVLSALENYGFCKFGEAHEWVQGGRIELGGDLPVNVNGGQNRETYMVGWNHTADAIRQLRGECGDRQVNDAELIMCAYSHGLWQTTQSFILRRG